MGGFTGQGLLKRLERYDFDVLPPNGSFGRCDEIRAAIRRFRASVFREFGSLPAHEDAAVAAADDRAWHLVARCGGLMAGCVRVLAFDRAADDVPQQMLANSGCGLSPSDRATCIDAIRHFVDTREPRSAPILQFGGLAVARDMRRSVLAVGLCLAATAFTRVLGGAGGVLLAAEKCRTEALYRVAGAFRLGGATALPPLIDAFHQDRVVLMGTAPFANGPEMEQIVRHFEECLSRSSMACLSTTARSAAWPR